MLRFIICIISSLLFSQAAFAAEVAKLPVEADGWNGGDAAYSRVLDNGKRLWLFGDSLIGKVADGKREGFAMPRNAVALQAEDGSMAYFWGDEAVGIFPNPREDEWYWPMDFAVLKGKAYFFMRRVKMTKPNDPLGFGITGTDVLIVDDVLSSPDTWKIRYYPLAKKGESVGVALAEKDGYLYTLVNANDQDHAFHLARLATKAVEQEIMTLTYYNPKRKQWRGSEPVAPLLEQGSPEGSLAWDDEEKEWRLIYMPSGFSRDIVMRTAKDLLGEWSEPATLYTCPEMGLEKPDYICYAGKEVYGSDKLQVTYSVNSLKPEDLNADADIYIPRIITP